MQRSDQRMGPLSGQPSVLMSAWPSGQPLVPMWEMQSALHLGLQLGQLWVPTSGLRSAQQ